LVNLLIAMMSRTYSETYEQSAIGVWRLQFAHLVRQYDYDILPPPLNLVWLVFRLISFTVTFILYQSTKLCSCCNIITDSAFGRFFSELSGDNLIVEFQRIDAKNSAKFWKYLRLAFCIVYHAHLINVEHDDNNAAEPPLLSHYQQDKIYDTFSDPIEFKPSEADENTPTQIVPQSTAISRRRAAFNQQRNQGITPIQLSNYRKEDVTVTIKKEDDDFIQ